MLIQSNFLQKLSPALLQEDFASSPDEYCGLIVEMVPGRSMDDLSAIIDSNRGKIHRETKLIQGVAIRVPVKSIRDLVLSRHVKKIWHDAKVRIKLNVAVPAVGGLQIQEQGFTGKDVTVAIIDTGIFPHYDLIRPENRVVGWHDMVKGRTFPYDDSGHGTHVAGIIAGNGLSSRGKYIGMAPDARLVGIKALDQNGEGTTSDIISALEWCIENKATYNIKVINLSVGATAQGSCRTDPLCRATSAAWESGMAVCAAAGNDGPGIRTINTPGTNPKIITVGNLDDHRTVGPDDDSLNESSSRGPTVDNRLKPDLLAPGTRIMSLRNGGGYRALTGTSMAAPMVTGAIAQMLEKWPSMKPDELKRTLMKNARKLNLQSNEQGSGALSLESIFKESSTNQKSIFNFAQLEKALPAAMLSLLPLLMA